VINVPFVPLDEPDQSRHFPLAGTRLLLVKQRVLISVPDADVAMIGGRSVISFF
jgi:hypothetical protein